MSGDDSSLSYCRRLARRARSSFPLAFRVLPPAKRDAMTALYAFLRVTDDLADEPGDLAAKRVALQSWRTRLDAALCGDYTHRVHAALHRAVQRYSIPAVYLHAVLDGVEADLVPAPFANCAELYPYCYRVASAVGLACLAIWGTRGDATAAAEAAGIAFQLTNILRDLGEDRANGRVYLPQDDLARFECPPETWRADNPRFVAMMRFQTERARSFYAKSRALDDLLSPDGRAVFGIMAGVYENLLTKIERRGYDVFAERVRVNRLVKLRLLAAAWPTKWGVV